MHFIDTSSELLGNIAENGFAVGLGLFQRGDVTVHTNYRQDWQQFYMKRGLMMRDPVVTDGLRRPGFSLWPEASETTNVVIRSATDFGIGRGMTYSSRLAGQHCLVGLSREKPLSNAERKTIIETVRANHVDHLIAQTEKLSPQQCELVELFANGHRAKDVARHFAISENAVKQRKLTIERKLGVANFLCVINICAMSGLTIPRVR